eukprot:SAG31_NODE_15739_length_740_cov_2.124805_2_plen_148_part_00
MAESEIIEEKRPEFLTIGSEICLQVIPEELADNKFGYVSISNSAVNTQCKVSWYAGGSNTAPPPPEPTAVRFTVCPPERVQERLALLEAESILAADPNAYTAQQMEDFRFDAARAEEDFARLSGTVVMFGQRISLYQVHSGRTLCIR